jgi:hypothetical protein
MKSLITLGVAGLLVAAVGTSFAQQQQPKPGEKPAMAPAATKPANPATPATPATPAPKTPEMAAKPAMPATPMAMPTPTPEVQDFAKTAKGTWKCTGEAADPMNNMAKKPVQMTMTWKLDLSNFWVMGSLTEKKTKTSPTPMKMTFYRSFDGATKTWHQFAFDNMGGWMHQTAKAGQNGVMTWEGEAMMNGMKMWCRDKEEMKGPKEVAMSGEISMDGKTWMPAWSATCTK